MTALLTPRRRVLDLAFILIVTIGPAILMSVTTAMWPVDYDFKLFQVRHLGNILVNACALGLVFYALRAQGRPLSAIGVSFRWSDLLVALGLCGIWIGLHHAYPFVRLYFWSGGVMDMRAPYNPLMTSQITPLLVTAVLVYAAYEEIIVRAYLMTEVIGLTHSRLLAIALSVPLQVSYHSYQGPFSLGYHMVGFLPAALYFAFFRRATPVVVGHALGNLWVVWGGSAL